MFLPVAGAHFESCIFIGKEGVYHSRSLIHQNPKDVYSLLLASITEKNVTIQDWFRFVGGSIRPVRVLTSIKAINN